MGGFYQKSPEPISLFIAAGAVEAPQPNRPDNQAIPTVKILRLMVRPTV